MQTTLALPLDIYYLILYHLNDAHSLSRCMRTCTPLKNVASTSSLWEPLYHARYKHHSTFNEVRRRDACQHNYCLLYAYRRRLDMAGLKLLHLIITERGSRLGNAEKLVEMGFDVWDALQLEADTPISNIFASNMDTEDVVPGGLTRRFWAENIIGVLARRFAAETVWSRLVREGGASSQDPILVEDALTSLSAFFGKSSLLIASQFSEMAKHCREYIENSGYTLAPDNGPEVLGQICTLICDFMRMEGYGPLEASMPLSVLQLFPHNYISQKRRTIPICLCHVFVAIARRLGISASAVPFPARVIVRVITPPESDDFFVDVYGSQQRTLLSLHGDIPHLLNQAGLSPSSAASYTSPATATVLLNRAVQNIFNARDDEPNSIVDGPADYASLCVIVMCGDNMNTQLIRYMMSCINVPALDSKTFLIPSFGPLLRPNARSFLTSVCADSIREEEEHSKIIKKRYIGEANAKYTIGTFFQHRKYKYFGLIYHWDSKCNASPAWIAQMGVDSLNRGATQPFYNSISTQTGSTYYVAEDNIEPFGVEPHVVRQFYENHPSFARWFSDIDKVDEDGKIWRMLPSPEWREMYPDDFP